MGVSLYNQEGYLIQRPMSLTNIERERRKDSAHLQPLCRGFGAKHYKSKKVWTFRRNQKRCSDHPASHVSTIFRRK